jgi:Na+-driven multidrug efflux pump
LTQAAKQGRLGNQPAFFNFNRALPLKARKKSQQVSLVIAYLCYLAALLSLLSAGYLASLARTQDPIFASLLAVVVFFIGCGVVLQVIGSVNLPDLKIDAKKAR